MVFSKLRTFVYAFNKDTGCGILFLIKTLYQSLTKTSSYGNVSVYKPKVLLMAPTGTAALNINGTTKHTALNILISFFGKNLPPLTDKIKSSLRNKLSDLKVIIFDEIPMVSNGLLFFVHLRLNEIFGSANNEPFAGIAVISVGNFFQLQQVGERPVYATYKNTWHKFESLWKYFRIFELTEVMRQCGVSQLINLFMFQ